MSDEFAIRDLSSENSENLQRDLEGLKLDDNELETLNRILKNQELAAETEEEDRLLDEKKSKESDISFGNCPCSGGCGANYNMGCPCSGGCGANYNRG